MFGVRANIKYTEVAKSATTHVREIHLTKPHDQTKLLALKSFEVVFLETTCSKSQFKECFRIGLFR
jgi:hypothetical protein